MSEDTRHPVDTLDIILGAAAGAAIGAASGAVVGGVAAVIGAVAGGITGAMLPIVRPRTTSSPSNGMLGEAEMLPSQGSKVDSRVTPYPAALGTTKELLEATVALLASVESFDNIVLHIGKLLIVKYTDNSEQSKTFVQALSAELSLELESHPQLLKTPQAAIDFLERRGQTPDAAVGKREARIASK